MFSSENVSDRLGISMATVRAYAVKFGIGTKKANRWFFTPEDVRILEERNTDRGNPSFVKRAK